MEEPKYIAKHSLFAAATIWRVLFCWLIIPAIIWIVKAVQISKHRIEFYDKYVIERWGVISKHEKKTAFNKLLSVSVNQSINGRIWNYGSLSIQAVGKWDVNLENIKKPQELKAFLESKIADPDNISSTEIN